MTKDSNNDDKSDQSVNEKEFTKTEVIYFGEMVAHESILETDVAIYFESVFHDREQSKG
jgi:hypothetical protein